MSRRLRRCPPRRDFTGRPSTSAGYAVVQPTPITLPSGAGGLALWVKGDGKEHWLRATLRSQGNLRRFAPAITRSATIAGRTG